MTYIQKGIADSKVLQGKIELLSSVSEHTNPSIGSKIGRGKTPSNYPITRIQNSYTQNHTRIEDKMLTTRINASKDTETHQHIYSSARWNALKGKYHMTNIHPNN